MGSESSDKVGVPKAFDPKSKRRSMTMGSMPSPGFAMPGMGGIGGPGMGGLAELKGKLKTQQGGGEGTSPTTSPSTEKPPWMKNLKKASPGDVTKSSPNTPTEKTSEAAKPPWMVELQKKKEAA